jgi:serine/threonine protein phosphatase 1
MAGRTFAIGDIHGDLDALRAVVAKLPLVDATDTIVFLGDYLDRGPHSAEVVRIVRAMERDLGCKVVCLRGNHEDAWLRVRANRWDEFVFPPSNGCFATYRSFIGGEPPKEGEMPLMEDVDSMFTGAFFSDDVAQWMNELPYWYEDDHAIYVHAGLLERDGEFAHPKDTEPQIALLWTRTEKFFREYRGKTVVIGHTVTELLPQELSTHTPSDPTDMWVGPAIIAIDTGAGKEGGFLTAVELPSRTVYESRSAPSV